MSHHNYPNHGRFRQGPTGTDSEAPPPDLFFHSIPPQFHDRALQNAGVPPALPHDQPVGHREDIPLPVGVTGPDRAHRIDEAHQGNIDYHPQPLVNPAYISPDVGHAQDIPAQVQPNIFVNQRDLFGYVPGVQAAFPHPFVHQIPIPHPPPQAGVENLRRLARHYLHHPDAQVSLATMEAGTAGRIKMTVISETPDF